VGGGGSADGGWVSKFYARMKGGATKIYVGVLTIFLKTLLKYHQINNQMNVICIENKMFMNSL